MLLALALSSSLSVLSKEVTADEQKAIIENPQHHEKIYDGETEVLSLTVRNLEITPVSGPAEFFFRVYVDDRLVFDEYPHTWQCAVDTPVTRSVQLPALRGPADHAVGLELWWYNQTSVKEDSVRFTIKVVKLQVDWVQSEATFSAGLKTSTPLKVEFKNSGNDVMYGASISLVDEAGLSFSPKSLNLEDVDPTQTREVTFEVSGLEQATTGTREARFEVTYYDFREVKHSEIFSKRITITKMNTNLLLSSIDRVSYNSEVTVKARLLDGNNSPLQGETLTFKIKEREWSGVTNESGYVETKFRVDFEAGRYELTASYKGSEVYGEADSRVELVVLKALPRLNLTVEGAVAVDAPIQVAAALVDSHGRPLSSQNIEFWVDSEKALEASSDAQGVARAKLDVRRKGEHEIQARYGGSGVYIGANASAKVVIPGLKASIKSLLPSSVFKGSSFVGTFELRDEKNRPIPNAEITLAVAGGREGDERILVTDQSGVAKGEFVGRSSGAFQVRVLYAGDETYEKAEAVASVTVLDQTVIVLIVAMISVALLTAFAVVELKTKKVSHLFQRLGGLAPRREEIPAAQVQIKPPPVVLSKRCLSCGTEMPEASKFCDICGASQEQKPPVEEAADERVYRYVMERGGTISLSQAASDLGISKEELKEAISRLRSAGRLEPDEGRRG